MKWFLAPLCFVVVAGYGAEYSRVSCETECASGPALCCQLLQKRVEHRTPPSDCAKTLKVKFALDGAVKGEDAVVVVKDGVAVVRAGRVRGLVYGAGLLLRTISYGRQTFSVDDGEYRFEPKKPFRMGDIERHLDNWYHRAPLADILEYIDDLVMAGLNSFLYQYRYPEIDLADSTEEDRVVFEAVSRAMAARIHELDCELCENGGSNQVSDDAPEHLRSVPNTDPRRPNFGFNVCPSRKEGMDYLLDFHSKRLKQLDGVQVEYFNHLPFDEGGCECKDCHPYGGNGFLKLVERLQKINSAAHPGVKTIVDTWLFHDDDWAMFYKYLETHEWIDYVMADSHNDFPRYPLDHPIPKGIPLVTFPEISMWGRDPWGGYGATPLPKRFERLFRQADPVSSGCMFYSEGVYEDVNKAVVIGLYVKPEDTSDSIMRKYAAYELPGASPDDFVKLCGILETNHLFPQRRTWPVFTSIGENDSELAEYRRRTDEACRIAARMDAALLPSIRRCWRWRILYLRTMIDHEIFWHRKAAPDSAKKFFEELVGIYHAEIQLEKWRKGKGGYTCPHF